jgi:dihydrofolate reductase
MHIAQIVAAGTNNVIGLQNNLLWKLPNDMRFFKNKTWGLPVIMGSKTFDSLHNKALPGRLNIVITKQANKYHQPNIIVVNSIEAAINQAQQQQYATAMIIGGGEIYRQSLPLTHTVYLTRVQMAAAGDTYYTHLPEDEWYLHFEEPFEADEKHAYAYSFQTWKRK